MGRVLNISTSIDTMQRKHYSPYGVTKAAIDAETIIWAQDLEGRNYGQYAYSGRRLRYPAGSKPRLVKRRIFAAAKSHGTASNLARI